MSDLQFYLLAFGGVALWVLFWRWLPVVLLWVAFKLIQGASHDQSNG